MNDERDEDLMRVYDRILKERGLIESREKIYVLVAESPAERFWITTRRAADMVRLIRKGGDLDSRMLPQRREMYKEIARRACKLQRETGMNLQEAVRMVVEGPAPKFYVAAGTVKNVITRNSKRR